MAHTLAEESDLIRITLGKKKGATRKRHWVIWGP